MGYPGRQRHVAAHVNITSRGNATSCLVKMPRLVSWKCHVSSRGNPTSRLVEISISMGKIGTLHAKYRVLPHVSTRVKMKLSLSGTVHLTCSYLYSLSVQLATQLLAMYLTSYLFVMCTLLNCNYLYS